KVRVFQAAHHDPDGVDAADNGCGVFALRFLSERKLLADVGVWIEEPRQHALAAGVEHVLRRSGKLLADGGNAAAADADIRRHGADARNDERAVADDEIEAGAHGRLMLSWWRATIARAFAAEQGTPVTGSLQHRGMAHLPGARAITSLAGAVPLCFQLCEKTFALEGGEVPVGL